LQGILAVINKKKTIKRKGRTPLLSPEQLEQLREELLGGSVDGGIWTGPKVARWMETKTGRTKSGSKRMGLFKKVQLLLEDTKTKTLQK
jgi:hypothetical protein